MKNFEKGYIRESRKSEKENFKKLKGMGDDTRSQILFVFDKYFTALDTMTDFIKMCQGPEDQKKALVEKTASLKADIQGFTDGIQGYVITLLGRQEPGQ
jgi:hypothetical protein